VRTSYSAIFVFILCSAARPQEGARLPSPVGTWEGESKCVIANSPCRDEHVVYRIAADKDNPGQLNIEADKIVKGAPQFMGTLVCHYQADEAVLNCTGNTAMQDAWTFHMASTTITGTLTIGADKKLYRNITVQKRSSNQN